MTLTAFSFLCLAVSVVILLAGAVIEGEIEYRKKKIKQVRDLHAENARLRARLDHRNFDQEWEMDNVKTQLAIKELLLRQKWQEAARK